MSSTTKLVLLGGLAYYFFTKEPKAPATEPTSKEPAKAPAPKKPAADLPAKASTVKTGKPPAFLKRDNLDAFKKVAAQIDAGKPLTKAEVQELNDIDAQLSDSEFAKVLEALRITELEYKQLSFLAQIAP